MKKVIFIKIFISIFFGFIANAQYVEKLVLSCDGGAFTATEFKYEKHSTYLMLISNKEIVKYINKLLDFEYILQGLDRNKYVGEKNMRYFNPTIGPDRIYIVFDAPQASENQKVPELKVEGDSYVIYPNRSIPDYMVGKINIKPGYYLRREGTGLKISFFRNENLNLGISGLYLGDWYFQNCENIN